MNQEELHDKLTELFTEPLLTEEWRGMINSLNSPYMNPEIRILLRKSKEEKGMWEAWQLVDATIFPEMGEERENHTVWVYAPTPKEALEKLLPLLPLDVK